MISRTFFSIMLALAATQPLGAENNPEEQAIRKFFAASDVAWNAHDAHQLLDSERTAPDADFVNAFGGWVHGLAAFAPVMEHLQAGPFHKTSRRTVVDQVKFVRPDVAVVIATSHDKTEGQAASTVRGTFVLSKEDGHWRVDSMQNTNVTEIPERIKGEER